MRARQTVTGGAARVGLTAAVALWGAGCVAGDRDLEPDELDARDLLGLAPAIAAGWDTDQRAAARARLMDAWAEDWSEGGAISEDAAWPDPARRAASGLDALDRRRAQSGHGPLIAGAGDIAGRRLRVRIASPLELGLDDARASDAPAAVIDAVGWRADEAAALSRGLAWAADLAAASGHPSGAPLRLEAVRQVPFGAVYLGEEIGVLVNPVLLAAIEPAEAMVPAVLQQTAATAATPEPGATRRSSARGGNPYSFYGSVAECAAAQRLRCEACLPSSTCEQTSRDAPDGNSECETLAGGDGAGYHLYCVNLSLAIATVAGCVDDAGPACPQDDGASNQLVRLEANRAFLDDAACGDALDSCLASIYGEPGDDYPPPPPDAGTTPDGGEPPPPPPPPAPRDTEISCGDADCDFSPQCDSSCSTSCDDAFSCNADCNGGEDGCNDGCDGCDGDGDDGDGSGGDGSGGCDSGDGGDGSSSGGGSSSGCDSDCGGSDCGDCSGSDCGDCNSSGSGGGSSNCSVARRDPTPSGVCRRGPDRDALLALAWALVPVPYLERRRRRARRLARREAPP